MNTNECPADDRSLQLRFERHLLSLSTACHWSSPIRFGKKKLLKSIVPVLLLLVSVSASANTFTVSNSGISDYMINGQNDPALFLLRGETYTFDIIAPGHPFWINSVQGTGTANVYNVGVTGNGTQSGLITFAVPVDAPDTLFYNCEFHSEMTGEISISNPPPDIHYVRQTGSTPTAPYTNWATAAASIQDAVDASFPGDTVLVSNGVYATGGRTVGGGSLTNRVVIDKAVTVTSVNGPEVTSIQGAWDPVTTNGDTAVRGVYVGADAILGGFSVTNGATRTAFSNDYVGGGIYAEISSIVSNCTVSGNRAFLGGGGVYGGTVSRSVVRGNHVDRGSGGLQNVNADNCLITANSTGGTDIWDAGAVGSGITPFWPGPFVATNTLRNCTIVLNDGRNVLTDFDQDGRLDVRNCVIWGNPNSINIKIKLNGNFQYSNYNGDLYGGTTGGTTNDPQFIDSIAGNYQLRGTSPGLDAGDNSNAVGATDLLGAGRKFNGTVDMGAYEAVNSDNDLLTDAEEAYHGTNPLLADSDDDGLDDHEEVYDVLSDPLLGDSDGDGFPDKFEWDNGYSPTNNEHQVLVDYIAGSGGTLGLFAPGTNDQFLVTFAMESSTNLPSFTPFPITEGQIQVNGEGALEFSFPGTNGVQFFRLQSE